MNTDMYAISKTMNRCRRTLATLSPSRSGFQSGSVLRMLGLTLVGLGFAAVSPALAHTVGTGVAATSSPATLCDTSFLPGLLNAVIQFSVYGAGAFAFATYVSTNALEALPIGQQQKNWAKQKRGSAIKGAGKVFAIGPVLTILLNAANLPLASCVTLVPF